MNIRYTDSTHFLLLYFRWWCIKSGILIFSYYVLDDDASKVELPDQLQKILPATEFPHSLTRWNTNEVELILYFSVINYEVLYGFINGYLIFQLKWKSSLPLNIEMCQ